MRRFLKTMLIILTLAVIPFAVSKSFSATKVTADAAAIYVSATGDDTNDGSSNAPYKTLNAAIAAAENGANIVLQGTVTISDWTAHGKAITLSGGTLDASGWSQMEINDDVTFENITLKTGVEIYANGYTVVMGENVTISTSGVDLYGGAKEGTTIPCTDLTVLSGSYEYIFGGSYKAKIEGDTNLTIGGSTKATYVFGGSNGSSSLSSIGGTSYLTISAGTIEGAYGGNQGTNCENDVKMLVTGGTFQQIFGGSFKAYLTGNVDLRLLGGTVTRRVYGGCYNEQAGMTSFGTSCYVNGKISLTLGGVDINFEHNESDRSIYARTRHKTEVNTETAILIFADATAYGKYKDKLCAQDTFGKMLMGSLTAADEYHYCTYEQNDNTITQTCVYCKTSATATLALDESVSLQYTGVAIEPAIVTYSGDWEGEKPVVEYVNNVAAGKATCAISAGQVRVELQFIIVDAPVILGGSVRLSNPSGLRFQSMIPAGLKDSGATFGTLMIPKEVLGDNELTHAVALVEDVVQKQWATEEVKNCNPDAYRERYEYFNAVLTEIPAEYYGTEIVARSYVCIDGEYYYSAQITRSIAQVAACALADGYTNDILYTYVDEAMQGVVLTMESEVELADGQEEYQLVLEGNTKGYAVIWTSSNPDVVAVDENGRLRVVGGFGVVVITAKLGSQTLQCTVVVTQWSKYY